MFMVKSINRHISVVFRFLVLYISALDGWKPLPSHFFMNEVGKTSYWAIGTVLTCVVVFALCTYRGKPCKSQTWRSMKVRGLGHTINFFCLMHSPLGVEFMLTNLTVPHFHSQKFFCDSSGIEV